MDALDPSDPTGRKTRKVGLEQGQLDQLQHRDGSTRDGARFKRLLLAKEVLQKPTAIFKDLCRPDQDDGVCYVGRPNRDYPAFDIEVPAPPGMVFCVFVAKSGKITAWRWEPADGARSDFPERYEERFGNQIWPK